MTSIRQSGAPVEAQRNMLAAGMTPRAYPAPHRRHNRSSRHSLFFHKIGTRLELCAIAQQTRAGYVTYFKPYLVGVLKENIVVAGRPVTFLWATNDGRSSRLQELGGLIYVFSRPRPETQMMESHAILN